MSFPDKKGKFGPYGGRFVPETIIPALDELTTAYSASRKDAELHSELDSLLKNYAGRPTPLYSAKNLSQKYHVKIYLKREDLLHTGAHKINNCLGQALLAKKMGKRRIIAETGAGQHGVASATVAALLGLECVVYMGTTDMERQAPNVLRMRLLGAEVRPVKTGTMTLKDAINEAIRDWITNIKTTHYLIGSAVGPHPYPVMVRDFQSVIGIETKKQIKKHEGRMPDYVLACVGGGSNSIGMFYPFLNEKSARLIGVEAGGRGIDTKLHAATLSKGAPGVLHGSYSYLLQDRDGQVINTHSVSAGLDYPGVGPEHSFLKDTKRVKYASVTDNEALSAFSELTRTEGIIPALESSHALAYIGKIALECAKNSIIIVCLSGRGDKDMAIINEELRIKN